MRVGGYIVAVCAIASVWAASTGCMSGTESIAADVSPEGWATPVELRYSNTDTLTLKEMRFTLRHSAPVEATDGRYIFETASPSSAVTLDTLMIRILPVVQGNELQEASTPPTRVTFSEAGDYSFTVRPLQNTVGVWSVGIDLNKTQRNGQR